MDSKIRSIQSVLSLFSLLAFCLVVSAHASSKAREKIDKSSSIIQRELDVKKRVNRIALASCAHQDKPQPFWPKIGSLNPDLFLFLGDNLYSDTHDMSEHEANYNKLFSIPGFREFIKKVPTLAIWDDHDYGWNDSGADYPERLESQAVFRKFFRRDRNIFPKKNTNGIFRSVSIGPQDFKVQIILLDTRFFRSTPKKPKKKPEVGRYAPNHSKNTTVLGDEQWNWLIQELQKPARIRIIASGYQVLSTSHNWESWNNFPRERQRLLALTKNVPGVIFVSGDRHQSRFYRIKNGKHYAYEVTSSSLTNATSNPKRNEVGDPLALIPTVFDLNFSTIDIDWNNQFLFFDIHSTQGALLNRVRIPFFELGI